MSKTAQDVIDVVMAPNQPTEGIAIVIHDFRKILETIETEIAKRQVRVSEAREKLEDEEAYLETIQKTRAAYVAAIAKLEGVSGS